MKQNCTILIVDDEPANLGVLKNVLCDEYRLLFAKDGPKAIELATERQPDLILLDVMMPGMDGYEVCGRLKANAKTWRIPVIFVTAMSDIEDEARGFMVGAVDYIAKPVSAPIVNARVGTQVTLSRLKLNLDSQIGGYARQHDRLLKTAIQMLGEAGHYNDTDTGVHIWRMAAYAKAIAKAAGWGEDDANLMELAAPMHDTGKIAIPDAILKKPAKLNDDEWTVMKTHSESGADILSQSDTPLFMLAAEIARYHHERWDGAGYPSGLMGDDIPESARIVAIADVFDALTMRRPYKVSWTRFFGQLGSQVKVNSAH